ncbi:MAG: DNA polymerase III subunit delta [Spirochaetaceae bacterium]|nr:DNA polymerase III subunit delta [Spirochaetaceae bacterium]
MTEIKNLKLPMPCYLLLGPEVGEKNDFIQNIKDSLAKAFGGTVDSYNFYPYDSDISDIISIMKNIPLFASAKLVLIKNCHDLKKKDVTLIAEYIKNPSKDCVLILTSDNTKADPVIGKVVPGECQKIFWEMFESTKKGWVVQFFRKEKVEIENNAVSFLADILEGDTESFKKECNNLALFFGQDEIITEEKIADFFYNRKEENVFSLFDYIAQGDLEKSVVAAKNMILSGESAPIQMLSGLLWQIKNVYEIKKMIVQKKSFSEACTELNIRAKKMQGIYSSAIKNYSINEIEKIITLTAYYDLLFRSIRTEMQHILLPVYLYSFIENKGENFLKRDLFPYFCS